MATATLRTAAEAMLTIPVRHPLSATVREIRDFFQDDHVHAALIVSPAGYLEAVVERADISGDQALDAAAAPLGRLAGRTVPAGASLADVHREMTATGRRRVAVTSADGRLLGLLCLKASRAGFCSDQDVRARGHLLIWPVLATATSICVAQIMVSELFSPALWRGYGRWILRRNAGGGWPLGDFMTATVDEQTTTTVRGACPHDCPDTCAMLISVRDGRAVDVRGDPKHPFTRGGLCVKVNNYVDKTYSPDRVLYPMRRTGPKGSGQFTRVSWDEALDEIAGRFRSAIAEHGPETVMPVSYLGTEGILNGLNVGDPFFNKLGATITERTYCDSGACTAYTMTIGATAGVDPESLAHSRYILIWACNMISTNLHLWPFVAEAQRRGAKVVVIDPVRHRTAAYADWYIPIRPGTDGALALAMMNVIIGEGLADEAYIRDYTVGYEELAERVQRYTPEWASEQTGIPADDIRTLAREYATSQPSMIRIGVAIERHSGGGQTVRSIACLPALTGAWRRVGGGLLQLPLWAFPVNWPALLHPELATPGTRVVNQFLLGRALTGELSLDPPVTALMVYNSNPVVVCPEQDKVVAGLSREDLFTVVSEHFLTDTARYADLVLPATTQLEQHDIMFSWGHFYVTLNTPAVEPLGEAISNTELFRRLAARMGFTEECFTRTDEQMMAEAFDWSAPAMDGISLESLRQSGWARLNLPPADQYAPHAEGNFPTPSGKVEFRSSIAEQAGNFVLSLFRQGSNEYQPGGTVDPLPHYVPPRETADAGYRLNLISPKSHAYLNSSAGDQPAQRRVQGEQAVTMHPNDATERGIADGQYVRVFNDRGQFVALARITDEIAPGVVMAPMGAWPKNAKGHSTVNAVNPFVFADLGNAPTFSDAKVEIELAKAGDS